MWLIKAISILLTILIILNAASPVTADEDQDDSVDKVADNNAGFEEPSFNEDNNDSSHEEEEDSDENSSPIPPGHLKPFGTSGTSRKIDIYKRFPKPELFFSDYVAPYIPVIMRNASRSNNAFVHWKDDNYFLGLPHSLTYWMPFTTTSNITFREFIEIYRTQKLVFSDEIPFFLSEDVLMPSPLLCEPVVEVLANHMLLISSGKQNLPIAQYDVDVIRCVYVGRQDFVLVSHLDFGDKMSPHFHWINVNEVDMIEFESMRDIGEYHKGSLEAGDCIYIPRKWFWQVNTFDDSKSVDITWYHKVKRVEKTECMSDTLDAPSIKNGDFAEQTSWTEAKKHIALDFFSSYLMGDKNFTYKSFVATVRKDKDLLKDMTSWTEEYDETTQDLFTNLDINKDRKFNIQDLKALKQEAVWDVSGELVDRIADFEDIMTDQQTELEEEQTAAALEAKKSQSPVEEEGKAAMDAYLNNYLKVLEDVLTDGMEELKITGQVPDLKKRLDSRHAEIDGTKPFIPKAKQDRTETENKKSAREEAKAKIKSKQEKDKQKQPESEESVEFSESEKYDIVDDSVIEEILAEDDEVSDDGSSSDNSKQGSNKKSDEFSKKIPQESEKKKSKGKQPEKKQAKQTTKKPTNRNGSAVRKEKAKEKKDEL